MIQMQDRAFIILHNITMPLNKKEKNSKRMANGVLRMMGKEKNSHPSQKTLRTILSSKITKQNLRKQALNSH